MIEKEKIYPPTEVDCRDWFKGCRLQVPAAPKVPVCEPLPPESSVIRIEYRCSTVSEMPARPILLLHPQSDEAQSLLPWFACCVAQTGSGCAHAARRLPCRRVPE